MPIQSVSKVIGHKKLSTTTEAYGHLYQGDALKACEAMARALPGFA